MKRQRLIFRIVAVFCAVFSALAFASCGGKSATSPFKYTFIGEAETFSDSVHTHGYKKETVSEDFSATYYYARVSALNVGKNAAVLSAGDFSLEAEGVVYPSDGFISFGKDSQRSDENGGSYTETVVFSLSESLTEKEIEPSRQPSSLRVSFALSTIPEEFTISYKGVALGVTDGGTEEIISDGTTAGEDLYISLTAAYSGEEETAQIKSIATGTAQYRYAYINETKVTSSCNALKLQATVGTEDVTVEADKFILKSGGISYTCKGFASSSILSEGDDDLVVTSITVTISSGYTIKSSEIGNMNLVFDCDISALTDYTLYYDGAELTQ